MKAFTHQSGQTYRIGDADIYVEASSNVGDPAILFLHGSFGTMNDFNPILPLFPPGYRLVGIDVRGHGKSTLGSAPLSYQRLQEDVEAIAERLGITRCYVVGFSLGGTVGYRLAASKKLAMIGLVTIGAEFEFLPEDPARPLLSKVTPESWRKKFPDTVTLYEQLNPRPDFDSLVRAVVKLWLDPTPSGHPGASIASFSGKLLAARGNEDHLTTLESIVGVTKHVKQAIVFNIPYSGHVVPADQPEMLMLGIKAFLASN